MSHSLVIVESPAKAKSINKILGSNYVVKASMGHVRDLPRKQLGVDIEKDFEPEYVTIKGRQKVITELTAAAKKADAVYLAPDRDREGEAIAWHLVAALKDKIPDERFFRVTYNEITKPAILAAFENPDTIDQNRVDAQQARRIVDRIVGYKVSPLLWRRIRGGQSAGRVQSVALRLVCEREQEIEKFVPEKYWILGATVRKFVDPKDPFLIRLSRINDEKAEVRSEEQARKIRADLDQSDLKVGKIQEKEISKRARPLFITSSLQQAASSLLGYTPSRTMSIAQKLYEGVDFGEGSVGVITYMRTDSVNIAKQAQEAARAYIGNQYGPEYVPEKPNFYKSRKGAQEAHEAIRPTEVDRTPEQLARVLKPEELKLYQLIWQRFMASQMAPARIAQRLVEVHVAPRGEGADHYLFWASASQVVFPGYMKVTGVEKNKKASNGGEDDEPEDVDTLPPLEEGEGLECLEWMSDEKETKPPPRYSEASLVRALEENGVGRPSTYAQILSTLYNREYIEKEKRALRPTDTGRAVSDFLVSRLNELFDVGFTANMEESLDEIENGSVEWRQMLHEFYGRFLEWLEKTKGPDIDASKVETLLAVVNEHVKEFVPPRKIGKRTYSDEKYVTTLREQLDEKKKKISERQFEALKKLVCRYKDQIPDLEKRAEELDIAEQLAEANKPKEPPRETTLTKLSLLAGVTYDEPRKVGKRTYDDKEFCLSLRRQVEAGKRLSVNQVNYLDQLFIKYADQIPDFKAKAIDLGIDPKLLEEDTESGLVLELMKHVKEWSPPVQRGKRTWDDREFYDSLSGQFQQKKRLSPKQLSALKKMVGRYGEQIPGYKSYVERFGLPDKKPKGGKKETAELAEGAENHRGAES